MSPMSPRLPLLLSALLLASPVALAHKAHQHGLAQMDLVREGDRVELAGLFAAFPRISRVQLQWIADDAQSGAELTPRRSQASLVAG